MAEMRKVDADLMFTTGEGTQAQEREWKQIGGGWRDGLVDDGMVET